MGPTQEHRDPGRPGPQVMLVKTERRQVKPLEESKAIAYPDRSGELWLHEMDLPEGICFPVEFGLPALSGPLPEKAHIRLCVDEEAALSVDGIFDDMLPELAALPRGECPYDSRLVEVQVKIAERLFTALTGSRIRDCVQLETYTERAAFTARLQELYHGQFEKIIGFNPADVGGFNQGGIRVFVLFELSPASLGTLLHELGHRVFPRSKNRYASEFGANYFMFLAEAKLGRELGSHGVSLPPFGNRDASEEHRRAREDASDVVSQLKVVERRRRSV